MNKKCGEKSRFSNRMKQIVYSSNLKTLMKAREITNSFLNNYKTFQINMCLGILYSTLFIIFVGNFGNICNNSRIVAYRKLDDTCSLYCVTSASSPTNFALKLYRNLHTELPKIDLSDIMAALTGKAIDTA